LGPFLASIENEKCFEIDPMYKMSNTFLTSFSKAEKPDEIEANTQSLLEKARELINAITAPEKVEKMPSEIK
jgi:hypothetical protein